MRNITKKCFSLLELSVYIFIMSFIAYVIYFFYFQYSNLIQVKNKLINFSINFYKFEKNIYSDYFLGYRLVNISWNNLFLSWDTNIKVLNCSGSMLNYCYLSWSISAPSFKDCVVYNINCLNLSWQINTWNYYIYLTVSPIGYKKYNFKLFFIK